MHWKSIPLTTTLHFVGSFCGFLKDRQNADTSSAAAAQAAAATTCSGGSAAGYPCSNIDLQAFLPLSTFGTGEGNDIWGWTDTTSGREFAIMGLTDGTVFVEITSPSSPVYLGKLPTATSNSSWRDIKVYNDYAFIVSEASSHGMQVFDLSILLTASTGTTFSANVRYTSFGNAHNIAINEDSGFAYAVGSNTCSGGLHMINIANPLAPVFAGCYSGDGYVHDTHCVIYNGPDTTYSGKELCFCSNEDTITIVDVTTKSAPIQLSRTTYPSDGYSTYKSFVIYCMKQSDGLKEILTALRFCLSCLTYSASRMAIGRSQIHYLWR